MQGPRTRVRVMALATLAGALFAALATGKESHPPRRARPLQWSADVRDAFFADAREKLEGTRPDYAQARAGNAADANAAALPKDTESRAGDGWSKLIAAETIETEIKRLQKSVATTVTTPGPFKGGGYKACRRDFSLLALLFGVAAEYHGQVRWQDVAPGLRDQFARAAQNCKVGTDQTFRQATERNQELAELVAGARPQVSKAEPRVANWADVADRVSLMQRLNTAHQERLTKWLANEREFRAHADDVVHEAQIIALIADVIHREAFEYWDDETYAGYAKELKQSATDVAAAAESGNYQQAQQAIGRTTKSCSDCHDGYRG